jgi:hypothetical protein
MRCHTGLLPVVFKIVSFRVLHKPGGEWFEPVQGGNEKIEFARGTELRSRKHLQTMLLHE